MAGCDANCGHCGGCSDAWERPEPDPRDQPVSDDERVHQTFQRILNSRDRLVALGLTADNKHDVWMVTTLLKRIDIIAHDHAQTLYARHAEFCRAEDAAPTGPPF